MPVIKVEKYEENYTVIMNNVFKERELSLKAKGLLALVLSLSSTWTLSKRGLATLSKDNESSLETAFKELEAHFYLTRERIREKGKFNTVYTFYEVPFRKKNIKGKTAKRLKTRGRQVTR